MLISCIIFILKLVYFVYFCDYIFILTGSVFRNTAKNMTYARDALADLFALTRFLIPVAFTDIAVDIAEQVTILEEVLKEGVASIYKQSMLEGALIISNR